jgi:hypothetical protein
VVAARIVKGKLGHIGLHEGARFFLEEEGTRQVLLHFEVHLLLIRGATLSVVKHRLRDVPNDVFLLDVEAAVLKLRGEVSLDQKLQHIRGVGVSGVDRVHLRQELVDEVGDLVVEAATPPLKEWSLLSEAGGCLLLPQSISNAAEQQVRQHDA